jgi:hypothetical protein
LVKHCKPLEIRLQVLVPKLAAAEPVVEYGNVHSELHDNVPMQPTLINANLLRFFALMRFSPVGCLADTNVYLREFIRFEPFKKSGRRIRFGNTKWK